MSSMHFIFNVCDVFEVFITMLNSARLFNTELFFFPTEFAILLDETKNVGHRV